MFDPAAFQSEFAPLPVKRAAFDNPAAGGQGDAVPVPPQAADGHDLLAEQEMTMMLRMLSRISDRLGVGADDRERDQARQLMQETNVYELIEEPENTRPE